MKLNLTYFNQTRRNMEDDLFWGEMEDDQNVLVNIMDIWCTQTSLIIRFNLHNEYILFADILRLFLLCDLCKLSIPYEASVHLYCP